jgi:hypothetical protein
MSDVMLSVIARSLKGDAAIQLNFLFWIASCFALLAVAMTTEI